MGEKRQVQLAKNTVILTVGKICTQCVSFFLLPLYTALLEPSDYGAVDLISTYAAMLLPVCNLQMDMGLFRFLLDKRNDTEEQKVLVSTVTNINHLQSIGFVILFIALQFLLDSKYKLFLALEVVLNLYNATMMQVARGKGRNEIYSVASFLSASLMVVLNVVFIAGFKLGALGMFYGLILSKIITNLYLVYALKYWEFYSIKIFEKQKFKEICNYSAPLVPNQLAWWVIGASDRIVVSNILGVAQNGIYSVANKFSSMYITFYNIFNLAWTESCVLHIDDDDSEQYLSDVISTMFSLFSAVCIGIVACMPFVFPLLINDKYEAAYKQVPILLCAVLCQSVIGLVSVVYTAKKMSAVLAKTSFFIASINLGTDLLLIRFIGLYAASLSTLIAYGVMMVYRCIDVQKYIRILIPLKKICRAFGVAAIVGWSYYSSNKFFQMISLLIAILYATIENWNFIKETILTVYKKIRR